MQRRTNSASRNLSTVFLDPRSGSLSVRGISDCLYDFLLSALFGDLEPASSNCVADSALVLAAVDRSSSFSPELIDLFH